MTTLSDLPSGLHCITIAGVIDDVDAVEQYLQYYPAEAQRCIPLALRDILTSREVSLFTHATEYPWRKDIVYPNMKKIPSSNETMNMLKLIWNVDNISYTKRLEIAASMGLTHLLPYLWEDYGVDSALNKAVTSGNPETVRMIMLLGTSGEARDYALLEAVRYDGTNVSTIIDTLMTPTDWSTHMRGADINNIDTLCIAVAEKGPDMIRLLLDHKADINGAAPLSSLDATPLGCAIENDKPEMVRLLLELKADVHSWDERALETAVLLDKPEIVDLLLEAKSVPNNDMLITAATRNFPDIVSRLLEAGLDVHHNNDDALRNAVEQGSVDGVEALLVGGAYMDVISNNQIRGGGRDMIALFALFAEHGRHISACEDSWL